MIYMSSGAHDKPEPLTVLDKRKLSGGVILSGKIDKFGKLHITPR